MCYYCVIIKTLKELTMKIEILSTGDEIRTGAVIEGNRITLHFIDQERGDDALDQAGEIDDPGAPSAFANDPGGNGGGGGGCFINTIHLNKRINLFY